jgi:ankyrin repeat protein
VTVPRGASECGHAAVATALLGHEGIDANEADSRGGTPLHYAADEGHVEVVTALLGHNIVTMLLAQEGIDANKADNDGRTALHSRTG